MQTARADRYERIRAALAMGPTPGPWKWWEHEVLGDCLVNQRDGGLLIAKCDVRNPFDHEQRANAALIAACDPDTIRALLAERDALAAEVERLQEVVRPKREDECMTLDDWRMRAYRLEENWACCSRACAIEQDKREKAEARADKLQAENERLRAEVAEWKGRRYDDN